MSAIFLSYRRDDSSGYAGRMFDNLAERFGRERVFMDIETLEPGMDFVTGIDRAIDSCGAVIAMIGPNWIRAEDGEGRRRLDNPHDFIRLEITSALTRGVRVIPVLVHNASMPPEQELPEPLQPLCRLQACEISDSRWDFDVRRLADVLEPLIAEPDKGPTGPPPAETVPAEEATTTATRGRKPGGRLGGWLAAVAAVVVVAGGGVWWLGQPASTEQAEPVSSLPTDGTGHEAIVTTAPPPEPSLPELPTAVEPLAEAPPDPGQDLEKQPVSVPASGGPSPEDLRQREIAELIHAAQIDLAELRLTRPADSNAFDRFQRVLELEPNNPTAREGLIAIAERYHGLAEDALVRDDPGRAQRYLDSARTVDPGADWLAPLQREIDQRRRSVEEAARAPGPDEADRAACLSACERRHQACLEEIDHQAETSCLRSRAQACEQRYESCMSDGSKMYMGQVALESECAGVHAKCRRSAAQGCASAIQVAEGRCATQLDACNRRCLKSE